MRTLCLLLLIALLLSSASASAQDTETINVLPVEKGFLETRDLLPDEQVAHLQSILERLDDILRGKEIGLVASRWDSSGHLLYRLRYNDEEPYAIASTFKAFAAFYYFMNTPQDEWNITPGSNVYNMVVFSDNRAAGNILSQTAEHVPGSGNPIEKFNDFMHTFFGISDSSGLNAWDAGALANQQITDARFAPDLAVPGRYVILYGSIYTIRNRFTASDAALATEILANIPYSGSDAKTQAAYQATRTLLSISDPRYRTNFDTVGFDTGSWRKYGYLSEADAGAEARSEIVVVPAADGGHLVIAMLSGAETGDSFKYALSQLFHELATFDHEYLIDDYAAAKFGGIPRSSPAEGRFNYGFVIPPQLNIYREPDETAPLIDNPLRDDMMFPVAPVHQGALVRFTPVDSAWGRLEWNDRSPPFRGANAYIQLSDVYIVSDTLFQPIRHVIAWDTPPKKSLILDKAASLLYLLENDRIVLATPVIVNPRETLDGEHAIGARRISDSRNRAGFPFVSFVSVYGENGQSIYSAPWQQWSQTYMYRDSRYSTGDILVPDWFVTVPGWGRARTDIFIFRWLGGFENPAENRIEQPKNQTLLFVAHFSLDELLTMSYPGQRSNAEAGWRGILLNLANAPILAPESYFADF